MIENWNLWEMITRATVVFIVLLIAVRLTGKKQLSQLTFFNYIAGIVLGTIAGGIAGQARTHFLDGLTGLIWWTLLTLFVGYLGMKSSKISTITGGKPTIVIKQGKILEKALQKLQLNMDDLSMLLREQKVFSVQDVETAVFEQNGQISILLKDEKQPVTRQDTGMFTIKPMYMPMKLIMDGKVIEPNLQNAGLSHDWLQSQLNRMNMTLQDAFYVELQKDGTLYVDSRKDNIKEP